MKAISLVSLIVLTSSAHADTAKRPTGTAPAHPVVAEAPRAPAATPASTDILPPPELPADPTSALSPFVGLDKPHAMPAVKKPVKDKPLVMNFGKDYVLGERKAPTMTHEDTLQIKPRTLTEAQVATVVQGHLDALQLCWSALPKDQRADAVTAELSLSIADTGAVMSADVDADLPDAARACITTAAAHWQFPAAETRSDVEYAVSLRSL